MTARFWEANLECKIYLVQDFLAAKSCVADIHQDKFLSLTSIRLCVSVDGEMHNVARRKSKQEIVLFGKCEVKTRGHG